MTISATYSDKSGNVVTAVVDGVTWSGVRLDEDSEISNLVKASGITPAPLPAPPHAPPPSFLAQDFMSQLTAADYTAIQTAITGSADLGLLWVSLLAQKDPISTASSRFTAGWTALSAALGATRSSSIGAALGIF